MSFRGHEKVESLSQINLAKIKMTRIEKSMNSKFFSVGFINVGTLGFKRILTLERRELSIYKMTAFRQYRYNTHIYAGSEGGGGGNNND